VIAYLFFAGESEPLYNEATAIVIQSEESVYTNGAPEIEFVSEATGPALYEWDEDRQAIYKEYRVVLNPIENEDSVPLEERYAMNDLDCDTGFEFARRQELAGNKIGGQPLYIEDE
jgi:hypothetical protein